MGRGNRKRHIVPTAALLALMVILSYFASGKPGEGASDEKAAVPETVLELTESEEDSSNIEEKDAQETGGEDLPESEELVFGRGIECTETLAENVARALKDGDTEYLVGVPFGEEFDYELYEREGNEYRRKEPVYDWYLRYLFDGEGHRFSGFSISSSGETFLGLNLKKCPASVFIKAFGKPDVCENTDIAPKGGVLSADWYFETAVLTVEEYEGYIREIAYRALGNAADGGGTERKSDFELWMATKAENEKAEMICYFGFDEYKKDVFYPPEDGKSDAESTEEFVEKYLQERGFSGQIPDSVIYDEEGRKFAESYRNDRMDKFIFVIYDGGKVCCAARDLRGTGEYDHIVYRCDESGNTVHEKLYDKWGMKASEASYRYHAGVPFPFITESWNLRYEGAWYFCREHKTWFYEECAELDEKGKVKATGQADEWNVKKYLEYPCFFTYRSDGKLKRIQEEIPEDRFAEELLEYRESYFGHMEFLYNRGVLERIEYHRSGEVYSTTDQGGTIDFDERGRMVHRYYYVTSGGHDEFYFYYGDERRPWAVLDWCHDIWDVIVYRPA